MGDITKSKKMFTLLKTMIVLAGREESPILSDGKLVVELVKLLGEFE